MVKKIKDLSKKQRNKICSKYFTQHDCVMCPLYGGYRTCKNIDFYKRYLEKEVEVDE